MVGKSYTMMGMGKGEEQGIIPRVRGREERTGRGVGMGAVRGEGVKGRGMEGKGGVREEGDNSFFYSRWDGGISFGGKDIERWSLFVNFAAHDLAGHTHIMDKYELEHIPQTRELALLHSTAPSKPLKPSQASADCVPPTVVGAHLYLSEVRHDQ